VKEVEVDGVHLMFKLKDERIDSQEKRNYQSLKKHKGL
jgi:hypothetical protein